MSDHAHESSTARSSAKESSASSPAPKPRVKNKNQYKRSKMPERVIGTRIENGVTRILIAAGADQGVVVGTKGRLIATEIRFVVDRVFDTWCSAPIDGSPQDVYDRSKHAHVFLSQREEPL